MSFDSCLLIQPWMSCLFFLSIKLKWIDTKPERSRPLPLTIEPKKILIKGKQRKVFVSLDIPLPKKDNQKDTSTDKVN